MGPVVKRGIKRAVKRWGAVAGGWMRCSGSRILTYHSVGAREHEMNVTPEAFREQMAWLASNVPVRPLETVCEVGGGVAVTFDDGYRDNFEQAAPVLTSFGLPATFFVVAGRVGGMLDHDRDPSTSTLMTWDEVRALGVMGFSIGSHTMTHRRLSQLSVDEQRREIGESKALIEDELGCGVCTFAYPFGSAWDYDVTSVAAAREAGYQLAVSNRYGVNDATSERFELRRIWIDSTDDLASFRAKVTGELDILRFLDSRTGLAARRLLNRVVRGS